MLRKILILLLFVCYFVSCTYKNEEEEYKVVGGTVSTDTIKGKAPVARFHFENSLVNAAGNNSKITVTGNTNYAAFNYNNNPGNSFVFDGSSFITINLGKYDTLTVCFWLKSEKQLKDLSGGSSKPSIIDFGKGAAGIELDGASGATEVILNIGNVSNPQTNIVDSYSEWNFVCLQLFAPKTVKFQFWNKLNSNKTFLSSKYELDYFNENLIIGKGSADDTKFFRGHIDDLRIYKRDITKAELDELRK